MSKLIDLTGQRFGRLVVIEQAEDYISPKGAKRVRWFCQCDCGNTCVAHGSSLKGRQTSSCGCLQRKRTKEANKSKRTHGKKHTRLYHIWTGIKQRCLNQNTKDYLRYGGRGISICEEWKDNFQAFYDWAIVHGYQDDLSIDRINNDKGYCPENCRWISNKAQANNRRANHQITHNGETHTITEWSEITGIERCTILWRLKAGWSVEKALTLKPDKK